MLINVKILAKLLWFIFWKKDKFCNIKVNIVMSCVIMSDVISSKNCHATKLYTKKIQVFGMSVTFILFHEVKTN